MPAFIYAFLVGLVPVLSGTAFQILTALGFGVLTFTGLTLAMDQLHAFAAANWGNLPANVLAMVGLLRVDQALNLIISAVTVKYTLKGMVNGTFKAFVAR